MRHCHPRETGGSSLQGRTVIQFLFGLLEGSGDGRSETRIQAGGCCRAVGAGLDYPHMFSAVVRVVWGRSLRERHMTGPLTGNMPPEADFHNRRPGASAG